MEGPKKREKNPRLRLAAAIALSAAGVLSQPADSAAAESRTTIEENMHYTADQLAVIADIDDSILTDIKKSGVEVFNVLGQLEIRLPSRFELKKHSGELDGVRIEGNSIVFNPQQFRVRVIARDYEGETIGFRIIRKNYFGKDGSEEVTYHSSIARP